MGHQSHRDFMANFQSSPNFSVTGGFGNGDRETPPQTTTQTTTRRLIRIKLTCVNRRMTSLEKWTLPDGNNAQKVCTLNTCECMDMSTQSDEQEPGRHDFSGECTAGDPMPKGWENFNPGQDGSVTPPDLTDNKKYKEWRCLRNLEQEGWPKGTKHEYFHTWQEYELCTCYKDCDQVPGMICTCKPLKSEVDDDGNYYVNCSLLTSMPKDYKPLVESGADPSDFDITQSEDPATDKEMNDAYHAHMRAWMGYAPCEACEVPHALTWDPNTDKERQGITDNHLLAFWQSSKSYTDQGPAHPEIPPTTPTTITTTTAPPHAPPDCCVLLNMNAFMIKMKLVKDVERQPINPHAQRDMNQIWECVGKQVHIAEKVCLAESESKEVVFKPEALDDRPNPPLCIGGTTVPANPATGEQLKSIRWKPQEFVVRCEKGEYPDRGGDNAPSYQFHCGGADVGSDGCPEPSHEKRLFLFKAKWEPCGKPCLADPTECKCNKTSNTPFTFKVKVNRGAGILSGFANALGESATDQFLEQAVQAINGNGVKQINCQCVTGRPITLGVPDVGDTLLEIASLLEPGFGAVMDRASGLGVAWDILEDGTLPPNSQGDLC